MAIQISISNAIGSRYRGSVVPPIDPDAQAFITAASITDPTQQAAINQLVVDLKGYSIWTKMKALYPFCGSTASQHKWNLKDPRDLDAAFRLVFSGGWTHSSTGALPNGTNAYANTFLIPSIQLTSSLGVSYYSRTNANTGLDQMDMGVNSGSGVIYLSTQYNASGLVNKFFGRCTSQTIAVNTTNTDARGHYYLGKTGNSANLFKSFKNGVLQDTQTGAGSNPDNNMFIGATSLSGNPNFYTNRQTAFISIGDGLTDTEAANFYTAVQAFQVTLGRSIGTQTVSDADAQAFVTNAGIVDQVEANAVNNLVIGLKADGLWTKMKAVYPFVGGTSTTNKYNLKNPLDTDAAFRLVFNGGWTFSSNGALPNGTNAFADSKYNLSTNSTTSNVSGGFYSRTNVVNGGATFGALNPSNAGLAVTIKNNDQNTYWAANDSVLTGVGNFVTDTRGLFVLNKVSLTEKRIYRNGSQISTFTPSSNTAPSINVYYGARNNNGTAGQYDTRELAFAFLGDTLTNTEVSNFYNRVQTFNTALARQV